jgi:hypothetical protein
MKRVGQLVTTDFGQVPQVSKDTERCHLHRRELPFLLERATF